VGAEGFRLVQVRHEHDGRRVGAVLADDVFDLTAIAGVASVSTLIAEVPEDQLAVFVADQLRAGRPAGPRWSYSDLACDVTPGWVLDVPVDAPEIWGAGVTYRRSRSARQEESSGEGGLYGRVYDAVRPELFLKTSQMLRVSAPGQTIGIRGDSSSTVPEPELALVVGRSGQVAGYTIANDVTARDIEAENPLYLPQAKIFSGCCALGPSVLVAGQGEDPLAWEITLSVERAGEPVFSDAIPVAEMARSLQSLVAFLARDNHILPGTVLMTGTGLVPRAGFGLHPGDRVSISITGLGTLENEATAAAAIDGGLRREETEYTT